MGKLVKSNLNTHNAKQFVESITESANSIYYVYLGKHTSFDDDNSPPTANNSEESSFYDQYRNMIYGKHVTNNDVSHMIDRKDWTSGRVYTQYDHTNGSLRESDFYAIVQEANSNYSVFKCLFNNNGAPSTDQPTKTETSANDDLYITTADKYQWKYMYELTQSEFNKFATSEKAPLKIDTNVTGNAVSGAIDVVTVNSGGSRYNSVANGVIKDAAVGGNTLILELESLVSANVSIDQSDANNSGTFTTELLQLFDEDGSSANPDTSNNVANGIVVSANSSVLKVVDLAGDFFGQTSNVVIKGASSGATAKISSVLSDTSSISSNTDFYKKSMLFIADGTGKGQAREISEYIVTGSARRVLVANAFTTQPDTTSRFEISPKVTISGDGSGAEARAIVNTVNFSVDTVEVTNRGSGYTFASAIVEGNTGIVNAVSNSTVANTANVTPIIGPKGGHGSDPINELYADTVGVSVDFKDDEGGNLPAVNDFRTVGILKDPLFANVVISMNVDTSNTGTSFTAGEQIVQDIQSGPISSIAISDAGSGYTSNATVTISGGGGSGATANAQSNSIGRISAVHITNVGESFESDPTVTIDSPPALPFNANSGITNADDTIAFSTAAHAGFLQVGDRVTYLVAAGNTALTNLANGTTYFISHANSTTVALAATSGGANIDLTKGVTEAGHTLTGETATATTKIGGGGQGFITARAAGTLNLTNVYGSFVSGLRIKGTTSGVTGNVHSVRTSDKSTSNASTFDQRLRLTGFSNQTSGAFTIDEQIKQEQTSANAVLHHINTDSVAAITNVKGNFMASDSTQTIEVEGVSSGQRFKFTGKAGPDLVKNSGEIMYVENIPPITRDDSQTESIKLMIKF